MTVAGITVDMRFQAIVALAALRCEETLRRPLAAAEIDLVILETARQLFAEQVGSSSSLH